MKNCKCCDEIKNESEFHWKIKKKNQRSSVCKKCRAVKKKPVPFGEYKKFFDYIVYRDGRVWSTKTSRFLRPGLGSGGYLQSAFCLPDGIKNIMIHRLVGRLFVDGQSDIRNQLNHKDGNKLNNDAVNLEWCSQSENMKHSYKNGLHTASTPFKGSFGYDHNRSIEIHEYDSDGSYLESYGSISEVARRRGCAIATIHSACDNNKTRKGFFYSKEKVAHFQLQ